MIDNEHKLTRRKNKRGAATAILLLVAIAAISFVCLLIDDAPTHTTDNRRALLSKGEDDNSKPKRLAIITFGILDHDKVRLPRASPRPPVSTSLFATTSSLKKHVIDPAKKQGYEVDMFVHSWDVEHNETIHDMYKDYAKSYQIEKGAGAFESMEAGLKLRQAYEKESLVEYDWVLVVRHDLFLRVDFELDKLNPSLFYISNWCARSGEQSTKLTQLLRFAHFETSELNCAQLETFKHDSVDGVPDMWFLSSPKDMDRVFMNFTSDLAAGVFKGTRSCCNHALAGGRIFSLHDSGIIRVGRYQHHGHDYCLYRNLKPENEWPINLGVQWKVPNDYDVTTSHRNSVCAGTFCTIGEVDTDHI